MNLIPLPELVVALAVGLIVMAARSIRRRGSISSAGASSGMQPSRSGRSPEQIRVRLIASCVVLVTISIPLILKIVPPNGVYGFRVSGTRSPEIWYRANEFMGWALLVAAAMAATLQIMLPGTTKRWLLWTAFLMPICGAVVASFAYLSKLLNAV
jgi:hypothetical protein